MKVVETKIYLKFISWFILVSLLPLAGLFTSIYIFEKDTSFLTETGLQRAVVFGVLISLALVFLLSLAAARRLSESINKPIQTSVEELSKVVDSLFKSIDNLSEISQNNSELSDFLLNSSQEQQQGLKSGNKAVNEMVQSLNQISKKSQAAARNSKNIDKLASESSSKSNSALDSLVAVKQLVTENQKLTQALDSYTVQVRGIAKRMVALSEIAKFLSLNVSIEANRTDFSEEFSSLVSQIRELNITSEQAANGIQTLAGDMQRQIEHAKQSSIYEWEETNKSIQTVGQTIKFLNRIVGNIGKLSGSIQTISQETVDTKTESDNIGQMISGLNKEAKSLVKHVDDVTQSVHKQLAITRSLGKSSSALNKVTNTLNKLVGKT